MPACGSEVSDNHWEKRSADHIKCWEQASLLLSDWSHESKATLITIQVDWSPALRSYKRYFAAMKQVELARSSLVLTNNTYDGSPLEKAMKLFQKRRTKILVRVQVEQKLDDQLRVQNLHESVVASYLHDVFIQMSLAAPGSCMGQKLRPDHLLVIGIIV
jgi:hypothetical protein